MTGTYRRTHEQKMIHSPGRRLLQYVKLRLIREHVGRGGRKAVSANLNLTSFIDFLIVVVVFLLMTFSASGQEPVESSIKPPAAENTAALVDAPLVALAGAQVMVDGLAAGSVRPVMEAGRLTRIDELSDILRKKREPWRQLNPGREPPGVVVLVVDGREPAIVVKSLFMTCAAAGYPNVSFMVG